MDENVVRLLIFIMLLGVLAGFEWVRPRRNLHLARTKRWLTNLSIVAINAAILRALAALSLPIAAVAAAAFATGHGIGLFQLVAWPGWLEVAVGLVVLDLAIWCQHLVSHKVPALWRFHQVHHADRDVDVTTALRFHPIEIALSMVWKVAVVLAIGASVFTVILFEIILNGCAMFNHANIRLPGAVDRWLRLFVVTPDMHRVHHSVYRDEHDTNFGFSLSLWDRVFRTYRAGPRDGHEQMSLGLVQYPGAAPAGLGWSLGLPFRRSASGQQKTGNS